MVPLSVADVLDINTVSRFLAHPQVLSLNVHHAVDVLVLCGNAILPIAEHIFSALEAHPTLTKTLVICGGIGHSTQLLYTAFRRSKKYSALANEIDGMPEAAAYELMLRRHYQKLAEHVDNGKIKLIIEDKSKNCGANAIETRRVLERRGITTIKSCIVVQDPTMSLRTLAAFQHTYQDVSAPPEFIAFATFVPKVYLETTGDAHIEADFQASMTAIESADLWGNQRFFDLLIGEIPRLRDDENGYGPRGKGFISHVDIPEQVENAWGRLQKILSSER